MGDHWPGIAVPASRAFPGDALSVVPVDGRLGRFSLLTSFSALRTRLSPSGVIRPGHWERAQISEMGIIGS